MGGLALLLAACSSGRQANDAQEPVAVQAAMPKLEVFHASVAAFGRLAAGSRHALSLSLPQAGRIVAIEVIAGQRVERGDVLLKLATAPASRSAYLQTQSAVKLARDDLARTERLQSEKLATNAQVDVARKTLADAKATLTAQAELGGAQGTTKLRAPEAGVITAVDVRSGQRIPAGTALVRLAPQSALAAQLGVAPADAAGIRTGMPVTIKPVYTTTGAKLLSATVALVGAAVNPQTHLVDVVATLDGHAAVPVGSAVSARIETRQFKTWAVPRDALQDDSRGTFVYQIEHGEAHRVDVEVLAPAGSPIGVGGALDPRAPVITLGSYEISDGEPVTVSSSLPSASAAMPVRRAHGTRPRPAGSGVNGGQPARGTSATGAGRGE